MRITRQDLEHGVLRALQARGVREAEKIAWATAWLEACLYPGLKLLAEALADPVRQLVPVRDGLGIDLQNISCVWVATALLGDVKQNGRVFLRNVRHGLYLLPFSVRDGLGIGCPVDPGFALGGERTKNPYTEKLAAAELSGIEVDELILIALAAQT